MTIYLTLRTSPLLICISRVLYTKSAASPDDDRWRAPGNSSPEESTTVVGVPADVTSFIVKTVVMSHRT